jgi:hypothetical protein
LWHSLGLHEIIAKASVIDRFGSSVLEALLRMHDNNYPGLEVVNLKETISVAA